MNLTKNKYGIVINFPDKNVDKIEHELKLKSEQDDSDSLQLLHSEMSAVVLLDMLLTCWLLLERSPRT